MLLFYMDSTSLIMIGGGEGGGDGGFYEMGES